jgi:hypothetical protein
VLGHAWEGVKRGSGEEVHWWSSTAFELKKKGNRVVDRACGQERHGGEGAWASGAWGGA